MLFMSFDLHIAGIFACLMDSFIFCLFILLFGIQYCLRVEHVLMSQTFRLRNYACKIQLVELSCDALRTLKTFSV